MEDILLEMDRILRPEGSIIIRDDVDFVVEIRSMMDAMEYDTWIANHEKGPHDREKILLAVKRNKASCLFIVPSSLKIDKLSPKPKEHREYDLA
ncbi:hypothetical protein FEM48_Zijuj07G0165300 [Ziziphus jujuba var. spinosa]|uniref:Methyltransferase n=1 Tax=Ziziphus jujuba var. spinosa TaxID=714518 RepID=A0A978V5Q6_ZIZJJ|nr:hypothetical protein FEM48_Zijuj07G0165300 [Ziziphus jujuba var. spinosa]